MSIANTSRLALVVGVVAALASPSVTEAQTFARRRVPVGDITGLEMGIEGSLSATPGDRVRWFVTLYEVLRRRDLRPSPDSRLEVTASFSPGAPVVTVQTDARGRAALEIPIPEDLDSPAEIRVAAVSPRNVRRVFSVDLTPEPRHEVTLYVDRSDPAPGTALAVFGRVLDHVSGRPVAGERVTLRATSDGPLMAPLVLQTDQSGVFASEIRLPDAATSVRLRAATEHGARDANVAVSALSPPLLWVVAEPSTRVAAPGQSIEVAVRVRRADGRPVRGARASFVDAPADPDTPAPRTGADGRLRLAWRVSSSSDAPLEEQTRTITIVHPGIGSMNVPVRLRVARARQLSAFAIDGGALVPGLSATVHVGIVTPDGAPVSGREVRLEAPRLGGVVTGTTDVDGVVTFEGTVTRASAPDACGGPTSAEATLIVDGDRQRLCLPVDPDAMIALHVDDVRVGSTIGARIERRPEVQGAPVEVTVLIHRDGQWTPTLMAVVPADEAQVTLSPPPEHRGQMWIRARPILPDARAARGGSLLVHRGGERSGFRLDVDPVAARVSGEDDGTVAVFLVPARHQTALELAVEDEAGPVAMALSRGRSDGFVRMLLASATPEDRAATVVLRERVVVAQPLPAEPVLEGLLRDPWRTRARFVRGRLGRLMRAVEDYADERVPDEIEEVGVRVGGRWRFNRAVLHAATASAGLGDEMVAALDGEPLDIDGLTRLDGAFTFDNVARRITRERLFRVLVMLRDHVRSHELDLPWARRGDPAEYLVTLLEGEEFSGEWPERAHLFDGWGTPLAIRRAPGGRSRFGFLAPVDGWELVSAGPDGRMGTGDDLVDPFRRVLPSSGIYAEAVGEDILLARLGGVTLGRATVESLAAVFEIEPELDVMSARRPEGETRHELPAPPAPGHQDARLTALSAPIGGVGASRSWRLPPERRRYAAVAVRFGRDGTIETSREDLEAGMPWAARLTLPTALRPGESLRIPIELVQLADAPRPTVEVESRGGAVDARLEGGVLALEARRPGMSRITVRIRVGDQDVETASERVRVVPGGSLRGLHSGTIAAPNAELSLSVPDDATPWRAHVVLGAPRALYRDPLFTSVAERSPAIVAWAEMMSDGAASGARVAAVTRAYRAGNGADPVSTAVALNVWAAEENTRQTPLAEATRSLVAGIGDDLATRAAVLAALASSVVRGAEPGGDALAALLTRLRFDGFRALATAPDRPAVMARMAAALLLVDRGDASGRALLSRARAALVDDAHGRRQLPGDEGRVGDGWIGTLALAIAARQAGDDALADELATNAMGRMYLVERLGPEAAFWALSASAYGVFGVDAPTGVAVEVDGLPRDVSLDDGAAVISVGAGATVRISSDSPVWVRAESRYLVPLREGEEGALASRLEGVSGSYGERAAYELVVQNDGDERAPAPVVELTLPGAARLDGVARSAIEGAAGVTHVTEPDGAGVVRLTFAPLGPDAAHRVPVPLSWIARGRTRGLSMRTYDASAPWRITSSPERTLRIRGRRR